VEQEIIIGVSIVAAAAIIIGIKVWLHNLLKFKMDESAVLHLFANPCDGYTVLSTEAISAGTDIGMTRVAQVCSKSKEIQRNTDAKESWRLKQINV
jgi:hypothetical protein